MDSYDPRARIFHRGRYASMHLTLMYRRPDFGTIEMLAYGPHHRSHPRKMVRMAKPPTHRPICRVSIKMIQFRLDRPSNEIVTLCDCQSCANEAKRTAIVAHGTRSNAKITAKNVHRQRSRSVEVARLKGAAVGRLAKTNPTTTIRRPM